MANVSSVCHHFSVHTRSWSRLPDMPTARRLVSAVLLGKVNFSPKIVFSVEHSTSRAYPSGQLIIPTLLFLQLARPL